MTHVTNRLSRRGFLSQTVFVSTACLTGASESALLAAESSVPSAELSVDRAPVPYPAAKAVNPEYYLNFHRGAGNSRPENTLETFLWAWNQKAFPECDIQFTKDGIPVCYHDGKLGRIAKFESESVRNSQIRDFTWDEVRKFDVGRYRGEAFAPEHIPTLESVFAAMKGNPERILYLDEKGVSRPQAEIIAALARLYGVEKQAFYTSGSYKQIKMWNEIMPEGCAMLWVGLVWGEFKKENLDARMNEIRENDFKGITHLNFHIQTDFKKDDPFTPSSDILKALNKEFTGRGILFQVITWSNGDKPETYQRLMNLGIKSFATDYPEVLLKAVYGK